MAEGSAMNCLTHKGESHDFTTRDELFAVARKITGTDITHIYRDGLRAYGFDTRPVMCEIGTSTKPVIFLDDSPPRERQQP
jgi:hypothetical protein